MAMFLFIFLTNIYRNIYIPLTTNNQLGDNMERQNAIIKDNKGKIIMEKEFDDFIQYGEYFIIDKKRLGEDLAQEIYDNKGDDWDIDDIAWSITDFCNECLKPDIWEHVENYLNKKGDNDE